MKTAMKRLLSFVLVAMMLVSVVPFQASADEETVSVRYIFNLNGDDTIDDEVTSSAVELPENLTRTFVKSKLGFIEADYESYEIYYKLEGSDEWVVMPDTIELTVNTSVAINAYPKTTQTWTIVVNLNGTEAQNTTAELSATPNENTDALKAALKVVTDGIDADQYEYTVGNWSIDETNKRASVNVTTSEKAPVPEEYEVTFVYCDEDNCDVCKEEGKCVSVTRTTVNQKLKTGDVPGVPDRYGYSFDYWKNTSNGTKGLQDTYTSDVTYVAVYKKDADSNLHKLKVFGVTYNHGRTNILSEPLATIYVKDEADLLTALQAKATAIQDELNDRGYSQAHKYTWDGVTFYDDSDMGSDDKVASGTEVTGNGNYYIKVSYTGNNKVQLYIHTSKTLTIKDTVTLTTYAPGETISKSQITTAVKNDGWSYGSIRTYTQDSWEKIVDRDSSSAADETKSFEVVEGETEIHVYLTSASSSSSSSNKSDNPKTGDTILMAVTVLGLSTAALAAVYFVSKKKQSV